MAKENHTTQQPEELVRYHGKRKADIRFQDGGLPHAKGVKHYQVLRATRNKEFAADGSGWTYNHAPMLTWWKDHFYISYLSNPISEHAPPCQVLLGRSASGTQWDKLTPLFPPLTADTTPYQGPKKELLDKTAEVVMHHRMVFFTSSDNRLLASTFYGFSPDGHLAPNNGWGIGRVVREVYEDFSFSPIYFLRYNPSGGYTKDNTTLHPHFTESKDSGFVAACQEYLEDRLVTQQWWEEERNDTSGFFTLEDMRALSYYTLPSGDVLGIGKNACTSLSRDGGETWNPLRRDPSIETGGGKVWGQKTADGNYALVYNPTTDSAHRWPLAVVTGENGQDFQDLLALTPEISPLRYAGNLKNLGAQYMRGIAENNIKLNKKQDNSLWLCYSMNKEDIWVCQVPLPITSLEQKELTEQLEDSDSSISDWNFFSPRWCPVEHLPENGGIKLEDSDLYDRAIAQRSILPSSRGTLSCRVKISSQQEQSALLVSLQDDDGRTPIEVSFRHDGFVYLMNGGRWHQQVEYKQDTWYDLHFDFDTYQNKAVITITAKDTQLLKASVLYSQSVFKIHRIRFASKLSLPWQTLQENGRTMEIGDLPGGDAPVETSTYWVASLQTNRADK